MNERIRRDSSYDKTIAFCYCVYVAFAILNTTQMSNVPGWGSGIYFINRGLPVCLLLLLMVNTKVKKTSLFLLLLIGAVIFMSAYTSDNAKWSVLFIGIMCVCGKYITTDRYLRWYMYVSSAMVLLTLFLYFIGVYSYDAYNDAGVSRLYLGFTYTTYLPNYFFHILLVYITLKKHSITLLETIMILIMNEVIKFWTNTAGAYYEIILLIVVLWIQKLAPKLFKKKIILVAEICGMPLLAISSIYLAYNYDASNTFYVMLDSLLSSRLRLGHMAINRYGFNLFGNVIEWVTGRYGIERTEAYFYVDASYLNIALRFGVVLLILIVLGFILLGRKAYQEEKTMLCIALIFLAIHSWSDPQLFDIKYNPFLIMIGTALLRKGDLPVPSLKEDSKRKIKFCFGKRQDRRIKYVRS